MTCDEEIVSVFSAPLRRAAIALVTAVGLTALSGCAYTSPAIITTPYVAADGTDANLPVPDGGEIEVRNALIVLDDEGGAGQFIAALTYSGTGDVDVSLAARDATQVPVAASDDATADASAQGGAPAVSVTVTAGQLTQIGPDGEPFVLPVVDVAPGGYVAITAYSPSGGSVTWDVPVLKGSGYYAGLTATTTSAPATTATPSPTGTTDEATEDGSAEETTAAETTTTS